MSTTISPVGKKIILTAFEGESKYILEETAPLMAKYALKCGADFKIVDQMNHNGKLPCANFVKLYGDYLLEVYSAVLWLDCDILVKPEAPSIFDVVPQDKWGAWCDEGRLYQVDSRPRPLYRHGYFNSGVMVIPKCYKGVIHSAYQIWANRKRLYTQKEAIAGFADQTPINRACHEKGVNMHPLDVNWNFYISDHKCREFGLPVFDINTVNFVHFAGGARLLTQEESQTKAVRLDQRLRAERIKEFKKRYGLLV